MSEKKRLLKKTRHEVRGSDEEVELELVEEVEAENNAEAHDKGSSFFL